MSLTRIKSWAAGEILTAADLNAELNNFLNNSLTLISPLTGDLALGGFRLTGLGAGSVASPALQFTSDADTGIYSAGADTVNVGTGGVLRLTVNSTGLTVANALIVSGTGPHAIGGATAANVGLYVQGSFAPGAGTGTGVRFEQIVAPGASADGALLLLAGTLTKAASGTHADFTGFRLDAPTVGAGAGALTNATTLKVTGAPSGATNNYALWVTGGMVRIADVLQFSGIAGISGTSRSIYMGGGDELTAQMGPGGFRWVNSAGSAERGKMTDAGILALGTTVTTSAGVGDIVLPNNTGELRGVNAAGTDTLNLVSLTSGDLLKTRLWTWPSADGTSGQSLQTNGSGVLSFGSPQATDALAGLALANNGSDATNDIDIAIGIADSDDAVYANRLRMSLTSALTKQLDAVWAVGTNQGMRASGAAIANTTYHIFLIERPDTGVVDIAADTDATGANIAANTNAAYTKKRCIGAILREAGAIVGFVQDGDVFSRKATVRDITATNPGTAAVTATLSVPVGRNVTAMLHVHVTSNSLAVSAYVSDLAVNDEAPTTGEQGNAAAAPGASIGVASNSASVKVGGLHGRVNVRTNTSAQVRYRLSASDGSAVIDIITLGWVDRRGRG